MIVVGIISVIAALAIPSLIRSRMVSNESAAIACLHTMVTAEQEFRTGAEVDEDADGAGEFGFLQEIAGTELPRGRVHIIDPPYVAGSLTAKTAIGVAIKSGYFFKIYLPGDGGTVLEEAEGVPLPRCVGTGINSQELYFVCYAWPMDSGRSGTRAFVVSESGVIFQTNMEAADYDGSSSVPAAEAAYSAEAFTSELGAGSDGNAWHPI